MTGTALETLLSAHAADLFHPVETRTDVFRHDPYDVEEVHAEARQSFDELVARASNEDRQGSGSILLLLGASGSGKTHLMRAFRNRVHNLDRGFVCYAQMTSTASNYARYLLHHAVESLDAPYDLVRQQSTGLIMLSDRLCAIPDVCSDAELTVLRTDRSLKRIQETAEIVAQRILATQQKRRSQSLDPEVVQTLLLLQRRNPSIEHAAFKYLTGKPLSDQNRRHLGGLVARTEDEDAALLLREIARVVAALDAGALVLCIDQLEDAYAPDDATSEKFRRTMLALREFTDASPNVVVVIGCLEDYWSSLRSTLSQSILDRIEQAPAPALLRQSLDPDQIEAVIRTRLHAWLEEKGGTVDPEHPLAPFDPAQLARFTSMRTRDVLVACDEVVGLARARQEAPDFRWLETSPPEISTPSETRATTSSDSSAVNAWSTAWDDFRAEFSEDVPDDEASLARLLADTLTLSAGEIGPEARFRCRAVDNFVEIEADGIEGLPAVSLAVCEKSPRGSGLVKQLESLAAAREGRQDRFAILRTSEFPNNPRTKTVQVLGQLIADGHRRVQCPPAQWQAFLAMRAFHARHQDDPGFQAWRRQDRPTLSLQCFVEAVDSLHLRAAAASRTASGGAVADRGSDEAPPQSRVDAAPRVPEQKIPPAATESDPPGQDALPSRFRIGRTSGLRTVDHDFELQDLKRHAAFLGGTGSGKTTLALSVLEAAALRGVPAILVDRKGDLATYADPEAWTQVDAERHKDAERLRAAIDVQLFTPGDPNGRDLAVPLLPPAEDRLSEREREATILDYASALTGLLPGTRTTAMQNRVIVGRGLEVLDACRSDAQNDSPVTVADLIDLLRSKDPALTASLGSSRGRQIERVAEQLEALAYTQPILRPEPGTENLDVETLLGLRHHQARGRSGRTRISILGLGGLTDQENVLFFVAHLLTGLKRLASRSPSEHLQALVFLDEADLYLPATSCPATKPLLEDGLKRFRSGGIGLLLGTQSPGDLDYKGRENIHTWFLGGIKQDRALKKLEPMVHDRDALSHLGSQGRGEFTMVQDGRSTRFLADRNLLETRQMPPDVAAGLARAGKQPTECADEVIRAGENATSTR
jgi:energy-coupling factor transporter ATP-binding protein EcfA2